VVFFYRCIYFSQGGECLYAASQDVLKVYGWEPARTYDTIPMGWGKIRDIATAQNQLVGASFHLTNVVLYVVDLKRVQPFSGESDGPSPSPFVHGQSVRKSFNQEKPLSVRKAM
jgi:katanin p80 WD40 repeat-containing subunit B1